MPDDAEHDRGWRRSERAIIAGHSHAAAYFGGRHTQYDRPTFVKLEEDAEIYGVIGPPKEEYWDVLKKNAQDSIVLLIWGGNDHNAWFLFETTPPFDFVRSDSDFVDDGVRLIPASLVELKFSKTPHSQQCRDLISQLKAIRGCRPILMETPPPKGIDAELRTMLQVEFGGLAKQRGVSLDDMPFTKREIRLKLWRSCRDAYMRIAEEAGIEFLPLPAWVFDAEGFLKREFWQHDATHASIQYGDLMRRHWVERFSLR